MILYVSFLLVVARAVNVAGQTEIGHFDDVVLGQENIPCGQVSVQDLNERFFDVKSTVELK